MQLAVEARCDKFRSLFGTSKVEIFVFRDYGAYLDFTQDVRDAAAGSITFPLGTFKYVNVWQAGATGESQPNGQPAIKNYTPQQIREVTAHEFGHAYQLSKPVNVAEGSGWASLKDDDLNHLDGGSPCDASNGPFRGVTDLNHMSQGQPAPQTICDETTHTLRSDYQGQTNRQILTGLGFNDQFFVIQPKANAELHAQMFALALVGNLGVRPMFDSIVDNGYFPKLKAFAVAEVQ